MLKWTVLLCYREWGDHEGAVGRSVEGGSDHQPDQHRARTEYSPLRPVQHRHSVREAQGQGHRAGAR